MRNKNLKYQDDTITNIYGVKFTEQEKKHLVSLVNSAQRKRRRMLEQENQMVKMVSNKPSNITVGAYNNAMNKESDFVIAKKTKSLQRFQNKEDYNRYIKNLERVVKKEYVEQRVQQYQKNYIKALRNEFGSTGKNGRKNVNKSLQKVINKIKGMSPQEYMKTVQANDTLSISFTYDPKRKAQKLEQIKQAVLKDENVKTGRGSRNNNR